MKNEIQNVETPEERELNEMLNELGTLETRLAQMELELATYSTELGVFESLYLREVGIKFAELDRINAEIAGILASLDQADEEAKEFAEAAREQAERSARESEAAKDSLIREKFTPSKELKELFRDLAKKIHPDLGVDEKDRDRRNRIMAEVNRAYSEGDAERLQEILREWQASTESIEGEGIGARLVRTIRMIALVNRRLERIEEEMRSLSGSELADLSGRFDRAEQSGRNLFDEMAAELDAEIELARSKLREARAM